MAILSWLKPSDIIHVVRVPPVKTFFPHFLALTLAFVAVLVEVVHLQYSISESLLLLGIFGAGTWLGALFVVVFAPCLWFWHLSRTSVELYLTAYAAGWIFAVAYNWLTFLLLVKAGQRRLRISFVYDKGKKFNIIKSPIQGEETTPKRNIRKLYEFSPLNKLEAPYTIAFVANPRIEKAEEAARTLVPDPILKDLDLFLHTVDRALQSFERDEVLGAAEIWSRVRVVTFFDNEWNLQKALVRKIPLPISASDHFLDTTNGMAKAFFDRLGELKNANERGLDKLENIRKCQFDVIFVLSAWDANCRSTARFSDFLDDDERPTIHPAHSEPPPPESGQALQPSFRFKLSPSKAADEGTVDLKPDHYATIPGRVALSVFGARTKTFIHEFAHAMSSVHAAITDEYYDPTQFENLPGVPFHINRLTRPDGDFRVPKRFASFDDMEVSSDMAHPSAEENWRSYFPERVEPGVPCTMDRSTGPYRFDRLISYFMYDRISGKLSRRKCTTCPW